MSFTPNSITGLILWLDASDNSTITFSSGSNVSQWNDKSSNQKHMTQSTTNIQPIFGTMPNNGLKALNFSGNRFLQNTSIVFPNAPYTVFAIGYGSGTVFGRLLTGTSDGYFFLGADITGNNYASFVGNGSWRDTLTNTPNKNCNSLCMMEFTNSGTSTGLIPYFNGTNQNAKDGRTSQFTGLTVGRGDTTTTQCWNGYVSEVIIYSSVLTIVERQQVEGYLAWRWGLKSSLPTNHPYYVVDPVNATITVTTPASLSVTLTDKIYTYYQIVATSNNTDNSTITYVSSNPYIAQVSATGNVYILAPGTATITLSTPQTTNFLAATTVNVTITSTTSSDLSTMVSTTNFNTIFDSSNNDGNTITTNYTINGTDIGSTYTLLGYYSNLKYKSNTNFIYNNNNTDLKDVFQYKIFDYANTSASYIQIPVVTNTNYNSTSGMLIIIDGSGDIGFNTDLSGVYMYIIAGGGGGGRGDNESGGGGGAGGAAYGLVNLSGIRKIKATIGAGGASQTSGGNTDAIFYNKTGTNLAQIIVYGGGNGGNRNNPIAGTGGSSGGNGSWGGGVLGANTNVLDVSYNGQTSAFTSFDASGNGGGGGEDNANANGAAGGGGGYSGSGQNGPKSSSDKSGGNGGAGKTVNFKTGYLSNSSTHVDISLNFCGGGAGGGASGWQGGTGSNGGGNGGGGSSDTVTATGKAASYGKSGNNYYYGSGGGGGGNGPSTSNVTGGTGANGVIILYIDSSMY